MSETLSEAAKKLIKWTKKADKVYRRLQKDINDVKELAEDLKNINVKGD